MSMNVNLVHIIGMTGGLAICTLCGVYDDWSWRWVFFPGIMWLTALGLKLFWPKFFDLDR